MKENSTEEDIILLKDFTEGNFKTDKLENYKGSYKMGYFNYKDIQQAIEHILSDYKGVLKENEELLQEKINNQKIIALAQNNMLNYQAGFEDGKNGRTSAVQSIIENRQYYIFQKQIEKYERHIEKLQKENEELNKHVIHLTDEQYRTVIDLAQNDINKQWIQKVKDKIEELEEELEIMKVDNMYGRYKEYGGKTKWERLFATKYGMHDALQELLEGRK